MYCIIGVIIIECRLERILSNRSLHVCVYVFVDREDDVADVSLGVA